MTCVHHLYSKGAGRFDILPNLMTLCADCHAKVHAGQVPRGVLLAHVAAREGVLPSSIEATIWLLRRLSRKPTEEEIAREMMGLNGPAKELVQRVLSEAGVLEAIS